MVIEVTWTSGGIDKLECHHRPRWVPLPPGSPVTRDPPEAPRQGRARAVQGRHRRRAKRACPGRHVRTLALSSRAQAREGAFLVGCEVRARAPSSVVGRRRRTVLASPGGSLVTGDAGDSGTRADRWRHSRSIVDSRCLKSGCGKTADSSCSRYEATGRTRSSRAAASCRISTWTSCARFWTSRPRSLRCAAFGTPFARAGNGHTLTRRVSAMRCQSATT